MESSSYKEQRLAQLVQNIQENLALLKAYERKRRLSKEPREQQEWDDQIADVKQLLEKDTKEKEALEGGRNNQGTTFDRASKPASAEQTADLNGDLREGLKEIKDEMKRGFHDLKRGQGAIYQLLTETRHQELKTIIALIHQGDVQQDEMAQMLTNVKTALSTLEQWKNDLREDVREAMLDAGSALDSEASLQGKLEWTLPIIPLFLDYKVELAVNDSVDLNQLWENTQKWWKSLTTRASRQAAQKLINEYRNKFSAKDSYLSEFETRINRGLSNINILVKAHENLSELAELSQTFIKNFENLNTAIDFPRNHFERTEELSNSIADQATSAADAITTNINPTVQINQIKRNLPMLQRIMKQITSWFQQMTTLNMAFSK